MSHEVASPRSVGRSLGGREWGTYSDVLAPEALPVVGAWTTCEWWVGRWRCKGGVGAAQRSQPSASSVRRKGGCYLGLGVVLRCRGVVLGGCAVSDNPPGHRWPAQNFEQRHRPWDKAQSACSERPKSQPQSILFYKLLCCGCVGVWCMCVVSVWMWLWEAARFGTTPQAYMCQCMYVCMYFCIYIYIRANPQSSLRLSRIVRIYRFVDFIDFYNV